MGYITPFYNKQSLLEGEENKTLIPTKHFEKNNIYFLGQLFDEKAKVVRKQPYDTNLVSLYDYLFLNPCAKKKDILFTEMGREIEFLKVTHKDLYRTAIFNIPGFHHSQIKWVVLLDTSIVWEEVWKTVHNFLSTYENISFIWEQIHLNFYTQYSYKKWHLSVMW